MTRNHAAEERGAIHLGERENNDADTDNTGAGGNGNEMATAVVRELVQSGEAVTADAQLAKLGYKAELPRNLSMISILGMSFAIMAVPFGISTTMYISLTDGQAVTVIWGWIFVSLVSLCIASSLAEICAVYPTAGGVYYWSAMLATKKYAPIASWITGWLTLVGNWTVTTSINFSGAQLVLSSISLWREDFVANAWQTILMFWCIMLICALVNAFCTRHLDFINKLCIYWTVASVLIIMITLLSMADRKRSAKFVFTHFDASKSGWPDGWAFFVGLLQAAYTLTGYGMVASMCEEVQQPHREVPRAMILSVLAAGITGIIYLIPILFVLPNVADLLAVANGQPIGLLFKTITGSPSGGFGLLFLLLGILFFAGTGALTASSRCTYAFARDGAIPGSRYWSKVNKKLNVPLNGIILSTCVSSALGLIYFGSVAAFNSFTGVATICLSTSYGVPVVVCLVRGRKGISRDAHGGSLDLNLIRGNGVKKVEWIMWGVNGITVVWICLACVLFCVPVAVPVSRGTMNYASVVFAGFMAVSAGWYLVRGRKGFVGPRGLVVEGEGKRREDPSFAEGTEGGASEDVGGKEGEGEGKV